MRRPSSALVALAATFLLLGLAACSSSSPPAGGRLTVEGQAEVLRPGEDRLEVTGSRDLEAGDRIRIRQGTAVIRLPDDRVLELRTGTDLEMRSVEEPVGVRPILMGGDLLVVSDAAPFVVGLPNAEVAVHGDARISRGVSLLVAVYQGTAQLSAAGSTLTVPALRQAALPATGQFPDHVTPLEYSPDDAWDQRYLSDAIDLGNQLSGRSDGFAAQLGPNEGRSADFFKELYPRLAEEPAFTASLLNPIRSPGETLVGAAITLEGTRGTFAERWAAVFGFRDQGAAWGLVALDQGVDRVPLLATIDAAIARGTTEFAQGPTPGAPGSPPPPRGGTATTVRPRPTPTTVPARPRPGVTTTTTTPRPSGPTTTVVTGPLNTGTPLDDTVNSLVNTLTGLLRSLGQQPPP